MRSVFVKETENKTKNGFTNFVKLKKKKIEKKKNKTNKPKNSILFLEI